MRKANSSGARLLILLFAVAALAVAAVACGGDDDGTGSSSGGSIAKIDATDRLYSTQDLLDAGFKKSKSYDLEGLPEATGVVYGFYGVDPYNRLEYEVRFYPSHAEASVIGVDYADEVTGPEAVILKDVQRYKEGLTERRQCAGNGGHHSGKCDNPKYFDYVVVGNMVVLCQGKDSSTSLQACNDLMGAVQ
ncbi:MAG: hypothetical protein QF357_10305 [Dehalococcoidia bacterium]|jgi:hypothetical protein|nr:hypothetical protein [Dehalococcoidia bacterium]